MLSDIINSIDEKLPLQSWGFASLITKEDKRFPAVYDSSGNYKMINFDFKDWSYYHRLNGTIKRTQRPSKTVGCDFEITEDIPMSLIAYFPNTKAECDDAFAAFNVSKDISSVITVQNDIPLARSINAMCVQITATSYETDSFLVWAKDWVGVEFRVPSKSSLVRIDYLVRIQGNSNCFESNSCIVV